MSSDKMVEEIITKLSQDVSYKSRRSRVNVRFEKHGSLPDGEALYRMWLDRDPVREGLTLDEVIRSINRRDEEKLGEDHSPGGRR